MKHLFLILLGTVTVQSVFSQNSLPIQVPVTAVAMTDIYPDVKKGDKFKVTAVTARGYLAESPTNKSTLIESYDIQSFDFSSDNSTLGIWNEHILKNAVLTNFLSSGYQYDLRDILNTESVDCINSLNQQGRIFNDSYLEDYLYSLVVRIYKGGSNYGRPGNLSIRILIDLEPNAYILPNGAILISTGLLSTINSEDELMGILAHEIAHFILDHPMVNYNKEVDRKKRAEFWAAFASIAAVSADAYLTFKNENHIPGILTATTMVAATVISDQVTTRLGIKYSREQEAKADLAASEVIESLGYDKVALSVALQRLKNYYLKTGNYLAISSSGTHPSIESRIQAIGIPTDLEKFNQAKYLKNVSLINSHNAWIELWTKGQPLLAYDLVQKNISSGVATEKDYIVKAVILRRNATTKEELEEVLTILQKAKMLNVTSEIQIHKEEGLTQLRLNNIVEAKRSFQLYLKQLEEFKIRNHLDEVEKRFTALEDEIQWTQKMIFKSDKF